MKTLKTPSLSWQNKLISTALASLSLILGAPQLAMATLPVITASNLVVQAGSATASVSNTNTTGAAESLTVTATSANTVLSWTNFSDNTANGQLLTANDTIYFNLPTNGAILNNITGGNTTILGGSIKSNGNVFFLNPAGVIIGANSNINVNGLYISTIPDTTAISYFFANGTLGVFNGVAQVPTLDSGIIYIQSGANISTASGTGQISLASAYAGAPVAIASTGSNTLNGNFTASTGAYTASFTLNNGAATPINGGSVTGITVDSLVANGNLTIISQGAGATVNAGSTSMQSGYPAAGGLLTGGNENITTNGGNVNLGAITNGGTLVVNTSNSVSGAGLITGSGAIALLGGANLTTNGSAITINSGSGGSLTTGSSVAIAAGSTGNINIAGSIGGTGSVISGNSVTLSNSATAATTLSSVTTYGTFTATETGSLTVNLVQSGQGVNITSSAGSVNVGSSVAVSTINGLYNTGNSVYLAGATGATFTNANVNVNSNTNSEIAVITRNTSKSAPVSITSVTTNGASTGILATSSTGTVTLSSVSVVGSTASLVSVTTANAAITLTNVSVNNGNIVASSANNGAYNYTLALTNITNNSLVSNSADSFTTTNGNITIAGYNSISNTSNFGAGTAGSSTAAFSVSTLSTANSSFGGPVTVSTGNGAITLTGITMLGSTSAQISANSLGLSVTTNNSNITVGALSNLNVATLSSGPAIGLSNQTLTISSTGNLQIIPQVLAPNIVLVAGGNLTLNAGGVKAYQNTQNTSSVSIQTGGDLSTSLALNNSSSYTPQKSLTLTSVSGNVNVDSSLAIGNTYGGSTTITATVGNVNISTAGAFTTNGLKITAGNNITENNNGIIDNSVGGTQLATSATLNAGNSINLTGNNTFPNITLIATGNASITTGNQNIGASSVSPSSTTNIATGTNVGGNLTVVTAGAISLGVNSTDTINVTGFTTLNTTNTSSSSATISTVALSPTLSQGVSALTNYANVSIGAAGGTPTIGQISVSANLGGSVVTSINTSTPLNLGAIYTNTLNINSPSVNNTSGLVNVSGNANIIAGTSTLPGSVVLGNAASTANISTVNLITAGSLTLNESNNNPTTIATGANSLSSVSIVGTTGNVKYTSSGGVANVGISTTSGLITYVTANTGTGSIATQTGSITATSTGLGAVSFNIGSANNSVITNQGSFTLNNVVSSGSAGLTVSANSGTTASTLTLGSGIVLTGNGVVNFEAGTTTANTGAVVDSAYPIVSTSTGNTYFYGKSISITNSGSSYGPISLTSNGAGNVVFTSNGNVVIAGMSLGTAASGTDSITSTSGNITQIGNITISNASSPITFQASSTGNNGVVLNTNTNSIYGTNPISIIASGNSALQTNNSIVLRTVTIVPAAGATPSATDLQLSVTTTSGNISQGSGSVNVWGNTLFNANGTNGVNLSNAGNNFGAITIQSGSTTGNVAIVEAATSAYNSVVANNFTATSTYGDIITATPNGQINVAGNSVLNGNNVTLTNATNILNGTGGTVYVKAAGNANLVDNALFSTIANGSSVGGNFTLTDSTPYATIQDTAGTSGITVTGIASLLATGSTGAVNNGQINFAGTNNKFGGLVTKSGGMNSVTVSGNLVLVPGSADTNGYFTALNGNITTSGSGAVGTYGYLTLVTSYGNVTVSNDLKVTSALTINAPLGTVNLSGMSVSVDLTNASNVVITPTVLNPATYIAPNP